jgi:hypothetical protein
MGLVKSLLWSECGAENVVAGSISAMSWRMPIPNRVGRRTDDGNHSVILGDNVLDNLVNIKYNSDAIVAQVALKESVSTAQNGLSYGASPNIAFRAIAFTGLSTGVTNSLSYNWSVDPVNGSVDIRRLQILFQYALGIDDPAIDDFDKLRTQLANTGYIDPDPKKDHLLEDVGDDGHAVEGVLGRLELLGFMLRPS